MHLNSLPTERVAVIGSVDPASHGAGAHVSGWVDCSKFRRICAVISVGVLGVNATVDAKLTSAVTSAGGTPQDISGALITQLTKAGADDSKQVIINLDCAKLVKQTVPSRYVKLTVTVGTAASLASAVLLGFDPIDGPASNSDATSVDEIVSV